MQMKLQIAIFTGSSNGRLKIMNTGMETNVGIDTVDIAWATFSFAGETCPGNSSSNPAYDSDIPTAMRFRYNLYPERTTFGQGTSR
ncbi:MAG: hypothetical protein MJZ68_00645 [archaeon]|nr:hypothetical protein [archaeon]